LVVAEACALSESALGAASTEMGTMVSFFLSKNCFHFGLPTLIALSCDDMSTGAMDISIEAVARDLSFAIVEKLEMERRLTLTAHQSQSQSQS
jgi:hypothetical protein